MIDYFFSFENYILYLTCFPIFLVFLFFFFLIGKRKINNNGIAFYGMFMGLNTRNVLAISFLLFYYYIVLVSIFVNSFSYINIILLFVPIILFNVINFSFLHLIVDIVHASVLFLLLYSKSVFYNYLNDVGSYWYVWTLYVLLCIFVFFYVTFIFVRRFKLVISHNKYIVDTKN